MVQLMTAAGRVQQALEEVCAEYGLKHDHYNVLRILRGAHPVGHPRYAISERLISRAPDVTRLLNRLIKEGLVKRYRSSEDQRLSMARATGKGLRLLEQMDPQIQAVHETLAGGLTSLEARQLSEWCGRVGSVEPAD
jgi:DNA-binding MarR family transcriptional regulator